MTVNTALELCASLEHALAGNESALNRLRRSVIRPLRTLESVEVRPDDRDTPASELGWELARVLTELRCRPDAPTAVLEATAAAQDLCRTLAPEEAKERLAALAKIQESLEPGIRVAVNGPYLVNGGELRDWLGQEIPSTPQAALCRCGASAMKPWCDGSHAEIGFTDAKDPNRVPNRLDRYRGQQITVLDNRGTCAHSGLCTNRVPTVFRVDGEPFVAASGGRQDEILNAVHACPSGALGYLENDEPGPDPSRPPAIEVSKDGPYRVTGGLPLVDDAGDPVARNEGASLEHYSMCRCGQSQNKPFCSGMHWYVRFTDPPMPEEPTLFQWCGGFPALLRMTRIFYQKHVPGDPLLAPLFAEMAPDHPERVAAWLGETFGGPAAYTDSYGGYDRMISQHLNKALTEQQRARWVALMAQSADEAGLPTDPEFRAAFVAYLEWGSRIAKENSTPGARPPQHMPVPHWWWVCNATPEARVSALANESTVDAEVTLPGPDDVVRFTDHIKPMFRTMDRQSMRFAFDLWSYDDVRTHAAAILTRVEAGTMPCDGAWPAERIDVFRRWVNTGTAE
jgi:CDGSH-type Zn-finger protein/truncated hemoglobin YjbI/ferredoxin